MLLTLLLLSPDPWAILGFVRRTPPVAVPGLGVHLVMFTALTVLAHAGRWTARRGRLLAALVVYALATELLQAFVPPRTVDLVDALENLFGIAAGTLLSWTAGRWCSKLRAADPADPCGAASCGDP